MDKPKGFLCNCSWQDTLKKLPDASRLKVYDTMFEYARTGKVEGLSLIEEVSFDFIKADIDRAFDKYKDRCEKNKENAEKRWKEKNPDGMQSHAIATKDKNKDKNREIRIKIRIKIKIKIFLKKYRK